MKIAPDSWERYDCESLLGASLTGQKKYREAEPLLIDGYEEMLRRKATIPAGNESALDRAGQRILHLYRSWGKTTQAAAWTKTLESRGNGKREQVDDSANQEGLQRADSASKARRSAAARAGSTGFVQSPSCFTQVPTMKASAAG